MKYFTIKELCSSYIANQLGINNTPSDEQKANLIKLVNNILDPVREEYGRPIIVNSGFRCPELNKAVNGAKNSQHMLGQAADITTGSCSNNKDLFNLIIAMELPYDQVIDESNYSWIHVSFSDNPRKHILHL